MGVFEANGSQDWKRDEIYTQLLESVPQWCEEATDAELEERINKIYWSRQRGKDDAIEAQARKLWKEFGYDPNVKGDPDNDLRRRQAYNCAEMMIREVWSS